jgi:hypothetical protein
MRLVETSAWIGWLRDLPLAQAIATDLPVPSDRLVPSVVQLASVKWFNRARGTVEAHKASALFERVHLVIPPDPPRAIAATRLQRTDCPPPMPSSMRPRAPVAPTCDRHFDGLPGVRYLPKTAQ